ncbi:MAG: LppX_LprAFG lipoprotein [Candidatus Dormibacteraeota bacterium]|nr:LppX_LprAFG lipoprotein [Candidatus Dormibacteraeota bacterium]
MPGPGRRACAVLLILAALSACGDAPPTAASLLSGASGRMSALKGFHFKLQVGGYTGNAVPVQTAEGDAHPPDLHASVDLREGGFLIEVEVIFKGDAIYLKSITGGWQRLTPAQVAQFFDARSLFDQKVGLFAAIRGTQAATVGALAKVDGHDTYPVKGTVSAARMHQLLTLIRDQGSYNITYWIESPRDDLWRAQVTGNLFDATRSASVTFDFSNHDHPVSVTPPPLG